MSVSPASEPDPLDVVVESIVERCRQGERPALEEYTARYPDLAGQLRELFPALVMMEVLGSVGGAAPLSPLAPAALTEPPTRLGDYRLLREVGRGGMGVVYEAVQESLGRHVALKVLPGTLAGRGLYLERFRREARAAARLHHTNIVPVFGVGEEDGTCYFAMQFIQGQGLDVVLEDVRRLRGVVASPRGRGVGARGGLEVPVGGTQSLSAAHGLLTGQFDSAFVLQAEEAAGPQSPSATLVVEGHSSLGSQPETTYYRSIARLGVQAAEALAYAHGQGVLHRDVKPSNLLLDTQGTLWVTDFGLAKAEDSDDLTHTGDIVGTLRYMAPERFEGKSDARSDVYGLGVTLYELLTLHLPFSAPDRAALIGQITRDAPPPPRQLAPLLPCDLETIVLKAMAREPASRYAGAAELAEDLRRFLENRPIKARRSSAAERFRRWCRRNPALARLTGTVALLLVAITVISATAALQYRAQLGRAESAERLEKEANKAALARLWDSYLVQARANRLTRRPGQRFDSLRAIQEALKLPMPEGRSKDELRTEAIACLLLPDLEVVKEWDGWPHGAKGFAIDPAFERYARGDADGNVSVRRVHDDVELCRLPGAGRLYDYDGLEFSPDGRFLAQRYETGQGLRGRLWKLEGPRSAIVLADHLGRAFSPAGRRFAASYPDGSIRLYDLDTGQELKRYQGSARDVSWMCWNPRRPLLAVIYGTVGLAGRAYQILNLDTGVAQPQVNCPNGVWWMDWHPDGRRLAVSEDLSLRNKITIWDTTTGRPALPPLEGHKSRDVVIRFNHAGDRLLSTDWKGIWRLWDVRTGQPLLTQRANGYRLDFSPDDGLIAADATYPKLRLYRFRGGQELCTVLHPKAASDRGYSRHGTPSLDPAGRLLALTTNEGVALVDVVRGEEVEVLPPGGGCNPLRFDATGGLLISDHAGVLRWPLTKSTPTVRRYGLPERVFSWPLGANGLYPVCDGQRMVVADRFRGTVTVQGPGNRVLSFAQESACNGALSPDGLWLACGSHENVKGAGAKIWNLQTGAHVRDLPVGPGMVFFSPDSKRLVTTGGGFRLWSVGTWAEGPALGGPPSVELAAFSADSSLLALEDVAGVARLVVPATGKEIARLSIAEQTRLFPLCFTPDGTRLVCLGAETEAVYIFDLRLIRQELAEIGLDWEAPPFPDAPGAGPGLGAGLSPALGAGLPTPPLTVKLTGVDLATDPAKLRRYEIQLLTLRLWANPFDAQAYLDRGRRHYQEQAWQRAHADFDWAFRLDGRLWQARHNRALTAYELGRWQQAREDASAVLGEHPERTALIYRRALACQHLGDHAQSISDLTRLIGEFPQDPRLYEHRAKSYAAVGKQAEADADRKKSIALGPNDADGLNARAWKLVVGGEPRDDALALELARKAVQLAPKPYHWNTLGVAYYRNGRYREAIGALEKSLAGPTDLPASDWLFLAMCHHRLGEKARAREELTQAVRWLHDNEPKLSPQQRLQLAEFRAEAEALLRKSN